MSPWLVTAVALAYVLVLFAIAWRVDRGGEHPWLTQRWAGVYALSLAVYCTSWTFYGGVGAAATTGWNFLPIYLGPALVWFFAPRFLRRMVEIARRENTTSIADFIAARYGKSRRVAALVAAIAVLGALPYVALQLKSIGMSFAQLTAGEAPAAPRSSFDAVGAVTIALTLFSIMFGARRYDATGRNSGLVVAIAFESVVKLAVFALIGVSAAWLLWTADPAAAAAGAARMGALFAPEALQIQFLTITLLAMGAIVCLSRQFHIGVVECRDPAHVRAARWPFLWYLAITAILVLPITLAGLALLPGDVAGDLYVIELSILAGSPGLALAAFIGGFAAATGMVIVVTVALSTMVANDLIAPMLLRSSAIRAGADMGRLLLLTRRGTIVVLMAAAYAYYLRVDAAEALASIGLIAFAAMVQTAPALIGGMFWPRARGEGARAGLSAGLALWAYTLLAPSYLGEAGIAALGLDRAFGGLIHPNALFGIAFPDDLTHGTFWSLSANIGLFVYGSMAARAGGLPRFHGRLGRSEAAARFGPAAQLGDLKRLAERFVGRAVAEDAFLAHARAQGRAYQPGDPIDAAAARLAERLIAGVIGAGSARVIVGSALSGAALDIGDVVGLLDETNQELQFSRELLSATLESISQGVSVIDGRQRLVAWNSRYVEMFEFPPGFIHVNRPIADVIRYNAGRGECGPGGVEEHVRKRLDHMRRGQPHVYERERPNGAVLKTIGSPMPGGGYVTTFTDITSEKQAQRALQEANEMLEQRVGERTAALTEANAELGREAEINRRLAEALHQAKRMADEANLSKTKFLAAASHDLLQPLHAARLFTQALSRSPGADANQVALSQKIDRSIAAADRLLRSLLDISKLDAGGVRAVIEPVALAPLIQELVEEVEPLAAEKGLGLRWRAPAIWVMADRLLLRQTLQNFVSNALRYTAHGGVLIAARRRGGFGRIEVWDTGPGVPADKREHIFVEFQRFDHPGAEKGAGLGLAIAARAAALMGARIDLASRLGRGSVFSVAAPLAAPAPAGVEAPHAAAGPAAGLTVLCLDNEPAVLEALCATLSAWGCTPLPAASFEEACAHLTAGSIDAALLDHHLDGPQTGLDLLTRIDRRRVTCALITADRSAETTAAAQALGAAVAAKPVDPVWLQALLAQAYARIAAE